MPITAATPSDVSEIIVQDARPKLSLIQAGGPNACR
jgi:hypothetical protein